MKLHNYIIAAVLGVSGLMATTSCSDWLEEKPTSNIGPEQVGDSKDAVDMWVTGVYSNWLYDMFCWNNFPFNMELDNDYISGPDWLFGSLGAGNFENDENIAKMWTGPYNLINDANMAIRYIEEMETVDQAYKNNAIGEMLFQKAFCYFIMVRAFGPLPYYETDVNNGADFYKPRTSVKEIYGHIIDMLEEAAGKMYNYDDANYQAGHVCAASAAGLLAKVYATMAAGAMPAGTKMTIRTGEPYETATNTEGKEIKVCKAPVAQTFEKDSVVAGYGDFDPEECYKLAAHWAELVVDSAKYGDYTKLCDYKDLWSKSNRDDKEFLFSVRTVSGDEKYCSGVHTYFSGYTETSSSDFITSGGWVGNTNNWYQLFDESDYRVAQGVRHTWRYYYQESYNGAFFYPQSWVTKITGYDVYGNYVGEPEEPYKSSGIATYHYNTSYECLAFTKKYEDVENKATQYTDSNYPFLRLADVYLIAAEAENEIGNYASARTHLNAVRDRSNAAQLTNSSLEKETMRSIIFEERAKELACEGDRRWDLIRWGMYLHAMNAIGGYDDSGVLKTRTARNLLYPIPTTEINANPNITTNNPGW